MQFLIALTAGFWAANESGRNDTYNWLSSAYSWTDGSLLLIVNS